VGYFERDGACIEGAFRWFDLPFAGYRVDGRWRRNRHRHPWFALRNNASGEHFIGQLAWTGAYSFEFDLSEDAVGMPSIDKSSSLFFRAGPDAAAPQRVIAAAETVCMPRCTWVSSSETWTRQSRPCTGTCGAACSCPSPGDGAVG